MKRKHLLLGIVFYYKQSASLLFLSLVETPKEKKEKKDAPWVEIKTARKGRDQIEDRSVVKGRGK